ncbi:divergent polysaccharide deacetylase family protein [Bacillus sp. B15-48]|uniref:divergent polysaccharide deacetylase family protein n=1 Tax=Bacillus sp. B15-48 TaxID=1548601 RepID=UPI00193F1BBC|nr:divergent polysaccharide deacetylase family protein [Bacillus sp. B15-48]MBM4760984.1 divergent polysaccharide deacetylase family protein [Bacillus sp. B15-48]
MRGLMAALLVIFSIFPQMALVETEQQPKRGLAIVIDDFGNDMKGTEEMLSLPIPLTVAVMPFLPTTESDAKLAHEKGHEVIVHLPMEPKKGKKSWLGPGAITTDLSDKEIRNRVEKAIENVPYAVGMNHHMGSKVTEDERIMKIILEVCREHGLFYLDSKTTGNSVIPKIASELSVPYLENDFFFDHIYSEQHIYRQAAKMVNQLEEKEKFIAIGHVGVTGEKVVSALKTYIPKYEKKAEIVPLSALIPESELINNPLR